MSASTEHPKVFISYSWSGVEHQQFVLDLATSLVDHGVDAKLDKWDLKAGQDKFVFMESMVTDPQILKVLVLCDKKYMEKANARIGGVGTESQIISQEVYNKVDQTKFIPVVCEYTEDGQPCLPIFMKGLIYVDMSTDERYGEGLDQLLRIIYEQPLHQRPQLGSPPTFQKADAGLTRVKELPAALRAIREGTSNREGLELLFVRGFLSAIEKLYVEPTGEAYDEDVYQAILKSKGLRDSLADYFDALFSFNSDSPSSLKPFITLLEGLAARFGPPERDGPYRSGWMDLFTFVAWEALLMAVASMLKHQRWNCLQKLLSYSFVVRNGGRDLVGRDFSFFDCEHEALEDRNRRLRLQRTSLSTDLLKERSSEERISFPELIQADVFLALHTAMHAAERTSRTHAHFWIPRTTVLYARSQPLPVFVRALNEDVKAGLRIALGVATAAELMQRIEEGRKLLQNFRGFSRDHWSRFQLEEATNLKVLAS